MYKVSILVPVYNVSHYIERCARSLFEQTYQNLEYIFVNDCTPDDSMELLLGVLDYYPDRAKAVKVFSHERNQGLAASRNTGLGNATGDFVVCVDSDDWLELDAIELLVSGQLKNDADIVTGGYVVHNHDGELQVRNPVAFVDNEQMVLQMMQRTWDHFVAGRLVRRSLYVENGLRWQNGFDVAEDRYMMTLLAYYAKVFEPVFEDVYHYERGNTNSLTKAVAGKKILRNNNQELGNVLFLEQFFLDKEPIYQKTSSRMVMEQLAYNLKATVAYSDKDEFSRVADMINGRSDDDRMLIGWKMNNLRDWVKHSYGYLACSEKTKTAISFIKKRVKAFVADWPL